MNSLNFTGNIGGDAEIRYTPDQKPVTSWSVALRSGYGKSEKTNWVRCTMFGDRGTKLAEYLKKGTQVAVMGELSLNEYTNKAGENKASLECNVTNVTLLGGKNSSQDSSQYQPEQNNAPANYAGGLDNMEDDIPF